MSSIILFSTVPYSVISVIIDALTFITYLHSNSPTISLQLTVSISFSFLLSLTHTFLLTPTHPSPSTSLLFTLSISLILPSLLSSLFLILTLPHYTLFVCTITYRTITYLTVPYRVLLVCPCVQ